jgi:hypothetical protein
MLPFVSTRILPNTLKQVSLPVYGEPSGFLDGATGFPATSTETQEAEFAFRGKF